MHHLKVVSLTLRPVDDGPTALTVEQRQAPHVRCVLRQPRRQLDLADGYNVNSRAGPAGALVGARAEAPEGGAAAGQARH